MRHTYPDADYATLRLRSFFPHDDWEDLKRSQADEYPDFIFYLGEAVETAANCAASVLDYQNGRARYFMIEQTPIRLLNPFYDFLCGGWRYSYTRDSTRTSEDLEDAAQAWRNWYSGFTENMGMEKPGIVGALYALFRDHSSRARNEPWEVYENAPQHAVGLMKEAYNRFHLWPRVDHLPSD